MEIKEKSLSLQPSVKPVSEFPDAELTGALNRSVGHSAKFALLLAMLDDNKAERPQLAANKAGDDLLHTDINALSNYRAYPLNMDDKDISNLKISSELLAIDPTDALLWQAMNPQPLSLYNDAKRLADEVVYNCPYHCQIGLKAEKESLIEQDATQLYDILESLPQH